MLFGEEITIQITSQKALLWILPSGKKVVDAVKARLVAEK